MKNAVIERLRHFCVNCNMLRLSLFALKVGLFFIFSCGFDNKCCAQIFSPIQSDTVLKPDTNNVVRNVYADSIVYCYYFDKDHSKLRTKYVYSLDRADGHEVLFIRAYCYSGQKIFEETYKNYGQKLETTDSYFTVSKSWIAYNGGDPDPLITVWDEPFKRYTQVGASLHWHCNGNRRDSTWYVATKRYELYNVGGGKSDQYKRRLSEPIGIGYSWYESGNLAQEWFYGDVYVSSFLTYYDSEDRKLLSKYTAAKNKYSSGAVDVFCRYFENGILEDSTIQEAKSTKELERYSFYKNGAKKVVYVDRPDYQVRDSYDSLGRPRDFERKALHNGKWYECDQWWYDNGQLGDSRESQQFYLLHPECGSLPDSLLYLEQSYSVNGTRTFYRYTLKNGDTYSFVYRTNGTLLKKVFFNRERLGKETEYDENGGVISHKDIDLRKK